MLGSLFNKVAGLKTWYFVLKKFQSRCFPVNIAKFLRISFFNEHLRWLLLFKRKTRLCEGTKEIKKAQYITVTKNANKSNLPVKTKI